MGKHLRGDAAARMRAEIARLYDGGLTFREVAAKVGRSYGYVHGVVHADTAVTVRPYGGRHTRVKPRV
jgi:hypothetical protein